MSIPINRNQMIEEYLLQSPYGPFEDTENKDTDVTETESDQEEVEVPEELPEPDETTLTSVIPSEPVKTIEDEFLPDVTVIILPISQESQHEDENQVPEKKTPPHLTWKIGLNWGMQAAYPRLTFGGEGMIGHQFWRDREDINQFTVAHPFLGLQAGIKSHKEGSGRSRPDARALYAGPVFGVSHMEKSYRIYFSTDFVQTSVFASSNLKEETEHSYGFQPGLNVDKGIFHLYGGLLIPNELNSENIEGVFRFGIHI